MSKTPIRMRDGKIRKGSSGSWQKEGTVKRIADALNITIQELIGIPKWVDEKNIWETSDVSDQGRRNVDEIQVWLDLLKEIRSASHLVSDVNLYEKMRVYVIDSLNSFTPEGLLRFVETINELKKVLDYQRSASPDEGEQRN